MQATQAPAVFTFRSINVRAITISGEPWFVASDVAKAMSFRDSANMVRILDEDEKGTHAVSTPSGTQMMTVISESGLFHAALKSRKPEAATFRKWVTSEVLPAIRRTGRYQIQETLPLESPAANTLRTRLVEKFANTVTRAAAEARVLEYFGVKALADIPDAMIERALALIDHLAAKAEARAEASRENGRKGGRPPKQQPARRVASPSTAPQIAPPKMTPSAKDLRKRLSFVGVDAKDEIEPWVVNNMRTNLLLTDWPKGDKLFAEVAQLAGENEHEAYRAIFGAIGSARSTWVPTGLLELGFSRALACAAIVGLRALRHGQPGYEPIQP